VQVITMVLQVLSVVYVLIIAQTLIPFFKAFQTVLVTRLSIKLD